MVAVLLLLALSSPARSQVWLREDFDQASLDPTRWTAYPNGGAITLASGILRLESGWGTSFPFVRSADEATLPPHRNFEIEVRMRFASLGVMGTGLQLARFTPDNGAACGCNGMCSEPTERFGLPIAAIWEDSVSGLTVSHLDRPLGQWMVRAPVGNEILIAPDGSDQFHTFVLRYVDGYIEGEVNGTGFEASTSFAWRPHVVWFGNPVLCGPEGWCDLEIDYIEVRELGTTGAESTRWGELKNLMR